MIKLGITGGIGSGKSTVSKILTLMGIPVYMADTESKKLTATSPIIKDELIKEFGEEIYEGNKLDKSLLASYIFTSEEKRQRVNEIIHPEVAKDFALWMEKRENCSVIGNEAAILFESGFNKFVDKTIMVYCPLETRISRAMQRDRTSRGKVMDRIDSQMPDEEKMKLADFVIYNDGTESVIAQTLQILNQLGYKN
ncbi:dephospho-CoA kinase [Dysgonomonas sp. 216]|uniref:dephospho-CoA kinase n=1 Tax=Dysgonomonas sp. 216 TaxID=2302934 RepID=UPI0013CF7839|nr:dephospho-CoA kinase [Dysgonomonas sp. 216]NDW18904.1 dephospho-CoA kinase [Dysgonomonas sp. 216]